MARVSVASQAWGYWVTGNGSGAPRVGVGPTGGLKDLANAAVTIYAAKTGATPHGGAFVTDAEGRLPGWVEPGAYKYVEPLDGTTEYVEAVSAESALSVESGHAYITGADLTGAADSTAAVLAAIAAAGTDGVVHWAKGTYLCDDLPQTYDKQTWLMEGVVLKARSNNTKLIRWSGSEGKILGWPKLDGNTKTGVSLLRITPADEAQTTTLDHQLRNRFEIGMLASADEGVVMACGPRVAGADSGCWKNEVCVLAVYDCKRSLWLKNATTNPGSNVNDNDFYGFKMNGAGSANTGIQIDAGSENRFHGPSAEGMAYGTSPNATPTGLKIAASGNGGNNDNNQFFMYRCEANTRDLDNSNTRTLIVGHTMTTVAGSQPASTISAAELNVLGVALGGYGPGSAFAIKLGGDTIIYRVDGSNLQTQETFTAEGGLTSLVEVRARLGAGNSGAVSIGAFGASGAPAVVLGGDAGDSKIERLGANLPGTSTGDKWVANAGLGVGNSAAATEVIGKAVVKKIEVFDAAGSSLGFVPVYSSIT